MLSPEEEDILNIPLIFVKCYVNIFNNAVIRTKKTSEVHLVYSTRISHISYLHTIHAKFGR